jgi:hypothetical protein
MKSRTKAAATTGFSIDTLTVFVPMRWKRRGGQKVIIAPDGVDAWAPTKSWRGRSRAVPTLTLAPERC